MRRCPLVFFLLKKSKIVFHIFCCQVFIGVTVYLQSGSSPTLYCLPGLHLQYKGIDFVDWNGLKRIKTDRNRLKHVDRKRLNWNETDWNGLAQTETDWNKSKRFLVIKLVKIPLRSSCCCWSSSAAAAVGLVDTFAKFLSASSSAKYGSSKVGHQASVGKQMLQEKEFNTN